MKESDVKPRGFFRSWWFISVVSIVFLTGWFLFWEVRNQGFGPTGDIVGRLPVPTTFRNDMRALGFLADAVLRSDDRERSYLVLFQNNLELQVVGTMMFQKIYPRLPAGTWVQIQGTWKQKAP